MATPGRAGGVAPVTLPGKSEVGMFEKLDTDTDTDTDTDPDPDLNLVTNYAPPARNTAFRSLSVIGSWQGLPSGHATLNRLEHVYFHPDRDGWMLRTNLKPQATSHYFPLATASLCTTVAAARSRQRYLKPGRSGVP